SAGRAVPLTMSVKVCTCASIFAWPSAAMSLADRSCARKSSNSARAAAGVAAVVVGGDPVRGAARIVEARRGDADDGHRPGQLWHAQVLADHGRVAAEVALPRCVAQHDGSAGAGLVDRPGHRVARVKEAPERRLGAEHVEEGGGDDGLAERELSIAV